jgi:ribosomal protein S18 acetylase RimI-like enzyme
MDTLIRHITLDDDLDLICAQMQPDAWGKDNEMTSYQPAKLHSFLEAGGILLLAYDDEIITGAALCYELLHPAGEDSLYVHELDTHPDYRHHGIATGLMNEAMQVAKERKLSEVWVGTETENVANEFYKTLNPYEIEPSIIYAYKVK